MQTWKIQCMFAPQLIAVRWHYIHLTHTPLERSLLHVPWRNACVPKKRSSACAPANLYDDDTCVRECLCV